MTMSKIISDPKILSGKPVIAGTRISVEIIMNFLGAGMSIEDILKEYKELKKSEILAAIDYAKKLVNKQSFPFLRKRKVERNHREIEKAPIILHEITR